MKKLILRAFLLLLTLLMVIPFAGCQETPAPQETSPVTDPDTDPTGSDPETDPETDPQEGPDLPEKNYGNREFLMVIRTDSRMLGELYVDTLSSTATSVERAVYQRLSDVSTAYGVVFGVRKVDSSTKDVSSNVKSGQDVYDLIVDHARTSFTHAAAFAVKPEGESMASRAAVSSQA